MPRKYRIKEYVPGGFYHIYNRGLEDREVFREDKDYIYFEMLIERYVSDAPKEAMGGYRFKTEKPSIVKKKTEMNLRGDVEVVAYCLMPEHFHLLVRQRSRAGITCLMRRVCTAYVMHFNQKYKRNGPLFESAYRAVRIEGEEQIRYMTRFIHLNPVSRVVRRFGPVETVTGSRPEDYLYSSYSHYIGQNRLKWIHNGYISVKPEMYKKWIENPKVASEEILAGLMID